MKETDVITIDGPTSSGKNSVGFLLAQNLGYQYIDTGFIYRAGCYQLLKHHIPIEDKDRVIETYRSLGIHFKMEDHDARVLSFGEDVTDELHSPKVTEIVATIAAIPEVRQVLKEVQRKVGNSQNTVMSGRDIGSEIFPDAKHKFYLTADAEIRAKRRFDQLKERDPNVRYERVLQDMIDRDKQDSTRAVSPMRVPDKAVVIDTSNLTVEQTVEKMLSLIKNK